VCEREREREEREEREKREKERRFAMLMSPIYIPYTIYSRSERKCKFTSVFKALRRCARHIPRVFMAPTSDP